MSGIDAKTALSVVEVRYVASLLRHAPADHRNFHEDPQLDAWWDDVAAKLMTAIRGHALHEFAWSEQNEQPS